MKNNRLDNYVYIYLDPRKPGRWEYNFKGQFRIFEYQPFYIGRGIKDRMIRHMQAQSRKSLNVKNKILDKIESAGLKPIYFKIFESLCYDDSEIIEIDFIKCFGRIDLKTGILSNMTDGGIGSVKYKPTKETKEKRKQSTIESSYKPRTRYVDQYDLDGNFIKTWNSSREAAKTLGCDETSITMCCTGKLKTSFKFIWKYNGKIFDPNPPIEKEKREFVYRPIFQYLDGVFVKRFENIHEYVEEVGCSKGSVWNACSGKTRFSTKYQLFYEYQGETIQKVLFRDPDSEDRRLRDLRKGIDMFDNKGNLIKSFTSISQACSENPINHKTLTKKIKTGKLYKGFLYKYSS